MKILSKKDIRSKLPSHIQKAVNERVCVDVDVEAFNSCAAGDNVLN